MALFSAPICLMAQPLRLEIQARSLIELILGLLVIWFLFLLAFLQLRMFHLKVLMVLMLVTGKNPIGLGRVLPTSIWVFTYHARHALCIRSLFHPC